ncbi:MAG: SpoIIE family protein phosphatase [Acidimicrobiia bacterium]|nr:SpoIIE family protein phosphatase [Acidimicrobiia bacterium]NNL71280.1 SpoIIE family protein phosphatase [Acidimicrobiia bacterium]
MPGEPNQLQTALSGDPNHRLQLALDAGQFGVWEWDLATGAVSWTNRVFELFGLSPGDFEPTLEAFTELVVEEHRATVQATIARTLEAGEPYRVQFRANHSDGDERWLEAWGEVVREPGDQPVGMIGLVADVSVRLAVEQERTDLLVKERIARTEAEAGRQRLDFLAQAFKAIGSSLDLESTTQRVLRVLVPDVSDWAAIYLRRDNVIVPAGATHRDPEADRALKALIDAFPVDESTEGGVGEVLRTNAPILGADPPDDVLDQYELTDEQLRQIELIGIDSYITVPLIHRGAAIGAIALGVGGEDRAYGTGDLELVEQIADRAAMAFRNAILFEERASIARVLQRSLLPAALPAIAGVEVAGKYASAGGGLDVGGDFYDMFQIDEERYGLAIGDVSGKGHEAAAVTALTRHTIRATALLRKRPSNVLRAVNEVLLEQSAEDRFCTAVYGVVRPNGTGCEIAIALAGHVPPVVARADGRIEEIRSSGVLLGMYPDPEFEDRTVVLGPGDTLVLYTDGLTDVKVGDGMLGRDWIRDELAVTHKLSVAEIVAGLADNVARSGGVLVDDVAILALQIPRRD